MEEQKPKILLVDDEKQFEPVLVGPGEIGRGKGALLAMEAFNAAFGLPTIGSMIAQEARKLQRKQEGKCHLPGCEMEKSGRGGYCCAEHCREHRRQQKEHKHK